MIATLGTESEIRLSDVADGLAEARRLGNKPLVRKILLSARGLQPRSIDDELTLGFVYLELGDLCVALDWFTHVAKMRAGLSMAHSGRALTLQLLGQPVEALAAVQAALALDPRDIVALKVLVRINLDMNLPAQANAICLRILTINPGDPDATALLKQAAIHRSRPPAA
jgi:tetratricopeptide (TPR) repeat protein